MPHDIVQRITVIGLLAIATISVLAGILDDSTEIPVVDFETPWAVDECARLVNEGLVGTDDYLPCVIALRPTGEAPTLAGQISR